MAVDYETFLQRLFDSGILSDQNLKFIDQMKDQHQEVDAFIHDLIQSKVLTKFQAEKIIEGKADGLFIGQYIVQEKLGAGGMGQVYKAYKPETDELVAIKVVLFQGKVDENSIKRFQREVKATEKLIHPNIITVLDSNCINGKLFMVMELLDGKDLFELINDNGKLQVNEAVAYIIQAAKALEFAHTNGVIHRDVKPANLIADSKGFLKLVDMGLAKFRAMDNEQIVSMLTTNNVIMGSADFMSPEQTVSTKDVDARTDIYSLGATFYFLLTAQVMYPQKTALSKLLSHRQAPIPLMKALRNDIPQKLDAIYIKMVAKKVEDRYQSMVELILDLEAWKKETPSLNPLIEAPALNPFQVNGINFLDLDDLSKEIKKNPEVKPIASNGVFANKKMTLFYPWIFVGVCLLFMILWIKKSADEKVDSLISKPYDLNKTSAVQEVFLDLPFDNHQAQIAQQDLARTLGLVVENKVNLGQGVNLEMILIPSGEFVMGSPRSEPGHKDDETQHLVVISVPFFIGKYEVLQEQWEAVMGNNPCQTKGSKLPVTNISWFDCQSFIEKLNAKTDGNYRLPTEAEWEFACRAGAKSAFSFNDKITKNDANYENAKGGLKPVGSYNPNAFGLYDMHGNVWEFCSDWYGKYPAGVAKNPIGVINGRDYVLRGGSFFADLHFLRSSARDFIAPDFRNVVIGLRLAKSK